MSGHRRYSAGTTLTTDVAPNTTPPAAGLTFLSPKTEEGLRSKLAVTSKGGTSVAFTVWMYEPDQALWHTLVAAQTVTSGTVLLPTAEIPPGVKLFTQFTAVTGAVTDVMVRFI
jgi:hypothetical protein